MRRDSVTGEVLDVGPDSTPCSISEAKRLKLLMTRRESQRGRLLRRQQECSTAQTSADDDLPFTDMDMDFDK